jgi:hypothetical protein
MIQLTFEQMDRWVADQSWFSRASSSWRFQVDRKLGLRRYQCEIDEGSSFVGVNMARCFLHDIAPPNFMGGLFWIVRTFPRDEDMFLFVEQIVRGAGITDINWSQPAFMLDERDYEPCFALVAMALMFGWDANFVAKGRRFLLEMDDEPLPALITDSISPWFAEVVENLNFKISELS